MKKIAIFASGTGTNAQKIIDYFKSHGQVAVQLVVSNKATAPVLNIAHANNLATLVIDRGSFYDTKQLLQHLREADIDFIVLAGFLWLIPNYLVDAFEGRMINIHPALLPKYGGKGMYGMHVHKAVKEAGEAITGMTIHYVSDVYDEGAIAFQAKCAVTPEDTPETIARKVQRLEHQYLAPVIESILLEKTMPLAE